MIGTGRLGAAIHDAFATPGGPEILFPIGGGTAKLKII
jgi:hypothetical protein